MNVSLRQLRAFVAVAELESFTGAAQQLHITQSALSLLVKDLESELGIRLLDRTTRSVRLAEAGHAFLPFVVGVLEDLERAIDSVADLRDLKRGVARIAAPQLMSLTLLPTALAAHRARHPGPRENRRMPDGATRGAGAERRGGPRRRARAQRRTGHRHRAADEGADHAGVSEAPSPRKQPDA